MKTITKIGVSLFACLSIASCVNQPLPTVSGRPEVIVRPPISKAQGMAIEVMTLDGFMLASQTLNSLTFERDLPPANRLY